MLQALWLLIPDEAYVLVVMGIGFAIMVGILSPSRGLSLIGLILLFLVLTPLMESLMEYLPDWAFFLLGLWFVLSLISAIFGRRVTENVISMMLFNLLCIPFRMCRRFLFGNRRLH